MNPLTGRLLHFVGKGLKPALLHIRFLIRRVRLKINPVALKEAFNISFQAAHGCPVYHIRSPMTVICCFWTRPYAQEIISAAKLQH